jgi:hypothetical protein
MAMFSAIRRLVRENIACSRCPGAEQGVDGAAPVVSISTSLMDRLPKFKTLEK